MSIKHCKMSYKMHFALGLIILYIENTSFWNSSGFLHIESHSDNKVVQYVL